MKRVKILFFCMIFVEVSVFAQQKTLQVNTVKDYMRSTLSVFIPGLVPLAPTNVVSPNFYVNNLGFFCKQELKLQGYTRIPVKLRLGSVQYCDWMEGKKNSGLVRPN